MVALRDVYGWPWTAPSSPGRWGSSPIRGKRSCSLAHPIGCSSTAVGNRASPRWLPSSRCIAPSIIRGASS